MNDNTNIIIIITSFVITVNQAEVEFIELLYTSNIKHHL